MLFPDMSANMLMKYPLLPGTFGPELIGLVLGGMVGTVSYTVLELGRK